MSASDHGKAPVIGWRQALWFWFKLGFISFGGPAGQISIMHQALVVERRWISEKRFLHALNYCMLLPGPEAQQLATYLGWLMHKTTGGVPRYQTRSDCGGDSGIAPIGVAFAAKALDVGVGCCQLHRGICLASAVSVDRVGGDVDSGRDR
jgi:hypothetical protein